MHEEEGKLEKGRKALDELRGMFKAWLKSDFNWAVGIVIKDGATGEEDEWDFLLKEWTDKLENWMSPYIFRLKATGYITENDIRAFAEEAYGNMLIMLATIRVLGEDINNV
jgi:hypothetical protein